MEILQLSENPSHVSIPLYGSQLCCGGFSSVADDFVEKTLDLNEYCIEHPSCTYFARAKGDSMTPAINSGDILIVDRSLKPRSGDIVVCFFEGEFAVRRFVSDVRGTWLHADNLQYSAKKVNNDTECEIWGVVSGLVRRTCHHG